MANIQERRNKDGKLISFSIRVHRGRDSRGKQLKPFSTTFEVPEGWTEARARKEADKEAVIFEKQCREGTIADTKQTFCVYADYVMALKERSGVKHSSICRYKELLTRINAGIGHIKLKDIKPQHLNQLYEQLSKDGINKNTGGKLSNKTIKQYHLLISAILAQAEKELLIPVNPARRASPPKSIAPEANYFQVSDVKRIVQCLERESIKWKTITYLLMFSGCRRGEILGLKWGSVDFITNTIRIENNLLYEKDRGIYDEIPKTGKLRTVKLQPETMALLRQYKAWQNEERLKNGDRWINTGYVFTRDTGEAIHPNDLTIWLKRFSDRHKLPHINPHAFRHTFASILIHNGVDIVTVSKTLGHERVSTTTDIYAKLMEDASDTASKCIADVILGKQA